MNGNDRHANGSITLEGIAVEWLRQRERHLARMTHQEIEQYNMAMDRLYLNAERVSKKSLPSYNINGLFYSVGIIINDGLEFERTAEQKDRSHGSNGSMGKIIKRII